MYWERSSPGVESFRWEFASDMALGFGLRHDLSRALHMVYGIGHWVLGIGLQIGDTGFLD